MGLLTKLKISILFFFLSNILISCTSSINLENRIGFGLASKTDAEFWASELGAQWYFDWDTKETPISNNLEYWQTIRVNENGYSPSREKIDYISKNFPGYTWIIGNEPDNRHQDNTTPEKYAQIYHELYSLIKENDKSAKIAIAGVSQPTPARMAYLNIVLETYKELYGENLPVDWWNIHAYVLREEENSWGADTPVGVEIKQGNLYEIEQHGDIDIFKENLINFRIWMKKNGYQNTPLVVSEYGILLPEDFGFSKAFIAEYLLQVNGWMLNYQDDEIGYPSDEYHLVQKFAWFSLSDPNFPTANLANFEEKSLTVVGEAFKSFSQNSNLSDRKKQ
jgi:hypothetical protein